MEYSPGGGGGNVQLESSLGLPQGVVVDFDEATALKLTPENRTADVGDSPQRGC